MKSIATIMMFLTMLLVQSTFANGQDFIVVDVRTVGEYQESHIKGAVNVDVLEADFNKKITELDKTKNYKVYCRSGNRSGRAEKIMREMGFKNVENLGSLKEAASKLNLNCDGKSSC